MNVLVLITLIGSVAAQCHGNLSVLTGSSGSVVAPPEFARADCQWSIQTTAGNLIEINFTDFFISSQPPFCQDVPGFPLVSRSTGQEFACGSLGAYCQDDLVAETCPQTCYLCDSCNYNYVTVQGTDGVLYFRDCQSIATPLLVDALTTNVFIMTTRSYFEKWDPTYGTSQDRLAFTWRALPAANHTHSNFMCNGTTYLAQDNGTFTDGSAPNAPYQPDANCRWIITAPADMYIELTFDTFRLQRATQFDQTSSFERCVSDSVSVIDGSSDIPGASLLGEYCGTNTPPVTLSSGQNLTILFRSDSSVELTGFLASYRFVANGSEPAVRCTSNMTYNQVEGEANVVSGVDHTSCAWFITPPPNKFVQITFLNNYLTPHQPSCTSSAITIMQGTKFLQKSCDQYLPPALISTESGTTVNVSFVSNVELLEYFDFVWTFVDAPGTDPENCTGQMSITADINETGIISDGTRYGVAYRPYQNCTWTITAPTGYILHLDYLYFSVEDNLEDAVACDFDSVRVYSGVNGTTLLQKACGQDLPNHVQSTTNALVVKFSSDVDVQYDGFAAIWSVVPASKFDPPCGGIQIINGTAGESGNITDDSGGYASLRNCSWTVTAPPGKFLQLEILQMNLYAREAGLDLCLGEYLAAWDGSSPSNYLLFQICGKENVGVQISTGSSLYLQYYSSAQIRNGGFLVQWTVVDNPGNTTNRACFGTVDLPVNSGDLNGTVTNYVPGQTYRPKSNCTYIITAPEGKYVQLTWNYFQLQDKDRYGQGCLDYVSVRDGNQSSGNQSYELQRSCGGNLPLPVVSTQHQLLLQFVTDSATQYYGFVASWQVVDQPGTLTCSGEKRINMSPVSGYITDGAEGYGYRNNARCWWFITAPVGLVISIKFIEIQLEPRFQGICLDYVQFFENNISRSTLCGSLSQKALDANAFTSETNKLQLEFVSDETISGPGFKIYYEFVYPPPSNEGVRVETVVAAVLLTVFGLALICCFFVWFKKRRAAQAIQHIDLNRGQDLNRKRTVSGSASPQVAATETTGPIPV